MPPRSIRRRCSWRKKGFPTILDIGALVEMPGGGLTVLAKDIKAKPDEVKRVIRAMQGAKELLRRSKEKSVELMTRILKMDQETPWLPMRFFSRL